MTRPKQRPEPAKPPSVEEFGAYFELLHFACNRSYKTMAKVLNISRTTIVQWSEGDIPTWPWWPAVFREALSRIEIRQDKRRVIRTALDNLDDDKSLRLRQEMNSVDWLFRYLCTYPGATREQIINDAPFSPAMIDKASVTLDVIKDVSGYGKNKTSTWRLIPYENW